MPADSYAVAIPVGDNYRPDYGQSYGQVTGKDGRYGTAVTEPHVVWEYRSLAVPCSCRNLLARLSIC